MSVVDGFGWDGEWRGFVGGEGRVRMGRGMQLGFFLSSWGLVWVIWGFYPSPLFTPLPSSHPFFSPVVSPSPPIPLLPHSKRAPPPRPPFSFPPPKVPQPHPNLPNIVSPVEPQLTHQAEARTETV